MTETDPGAARPKAGTVGVHRQDVSKPVTDTESLNAVRQSRPGPEPVAAARDTETTRDAETTRDTETRGAGEGRKGHDEIAEVRQEIERTRDDLGDTIEALAAKADVKARAQERVHATTAAARARMAGVTGRVREVTPEPLRGAAGRVGEQARRRPGLVAGAGAVATALLVLRRISRSQGRMTRPGMSGMFQKRPGGTAGMPRMRGGARTDRGMFGASGRTGTARGGARPFGSGMSGAKSRAGATSMFGAKRGARMFGARSRTGGMGPLGGKGAFGGKRTFGGMSMFGRKGTLGGAGVFGRKSRRGGTGMLGMLGRSRVFGGRRLFPQPRRSLMRRFAHR